MDVYYSALTHGFFDLRLKASYDEAGSWPNDAVVVSENDYRALFEGQAKGKIITPNKDGYPVLVDPPPPTAEQLKRAIEQKKQELMREAGSCIAPFQDALDLDMATEAEKAALRAWKKYRVLLNRVDISTAPDIDWPELPTAQATSETVAETAESESIMTRR